MMLARIFVAGFLLWPMAAAAEPEVLVGASVPFSADELTDAVRLRVPLSRDVRVTRRDDAVVVEVGDAKQTVTIASTDSHEAARVVAMVIIALDRRPHESVVDDAGDREMPGVLVPAAAPAPPAKPAFRRWSARATIGRGRDDNGTFTTPITGALSFAIVPNARLVASASLMKATQPRPKESFVPVRLGLEGRGGAAGLELGAFVARQSDCARKTRAVYGGYVSGRVYLAVTSRHSVIIEANGYWAVDQAFGCDQDLPPFEVDPSAPYTYTLHGKVYGASLGAGVEWQL